MGGGEDWSLSRLRLGDVFWCDAVDEFDDQKVREVRRGRRVWLIGTLGAFFRVSAVAGKVVC